MTHDDAMSAIYGEIAGHWQEMRRDPYVPAMTCTDHVHNLAPAENSEMDDRDWGIYNAGVLRGLELAAAAVEDAEDSE